jgi:hypothetical protein
MDTATVSTGGDRRSQQRAAGKSVYTLSDLGITPDRARKWLKLAAVPEEVFRKAMAETRSQAEAGDGDALSEAALWRSIRKLHPAATAPQEGAPRSRAVYGASPIRSRQRPQRRQRRTKGEMEELRAALYGVLENDHPMTVRQVFYRMVSAGVIDKLESQYNSVVCRLLGIMRRDGDIPFGWIADATRWMRKPRSYSSAEDMLDRTAAAYRQALWADQDAYVEIWLEKDALAGVIYPITAKWDVPLMVTRGYPSLSFLYQAAVDMAQEEKPCFLYYFGDHDPSGLDIPRRVERDLRGFAPDVDLTFERVAVTMEQVEAWDLQTRPTKEWKSRPKGFEGESIEVDAIPPDKLRDLVEECIVQHIDQDLLRRTKMIEKAERETLQGIVRRLNGSEGHDDMDK